MTTPTSNRPTDDTAADVIDMYQAGHKTGAITEATGMPRTSPEAIRALDWAFQQINELTEENRWLREQVAHTSISLGAALRIAADATAGTTEHPGDI